MSLVDILEQHGVAIQQAPHRNVRSGWVGVDCPSCSPGSGKYRLGFEIGTGRSVCWVCGRVDTAQVLADLCRISLTDAIKAVRSAGHGYIPTEQPTGRLVLPDSEDLQPVHRVYLENRGFDPDEVARVWGVRGIGPVGRLKWRLLIPIHDQRGRVVSWTTRSVRRDEKLRYISASPEEEATPHKSLLYGAHKATHTIVIQEGPIDCWTVGPGAVATFGMSFSPAQLAAMMSFPRRVVCFDAEPAAIRKAEKLCRDLSAAAGTTEMVVWESGKDASSAHPDEVLELKSRFL